MNISNPSPGNLYGFVALSALIGVLATVLLATQLQYRYQYLMFQRQANLAVLHADLSSQETRVGENEARESNRIDDRQRAADLARTIVQFDTHKDQIVQLSAKIQKIGTIARVVSIVLLIIAGWGFKRWYALQRMMDKLLAAEVAKLNPPGS